MQIEELKKISEAELQKLLASTRENLRVLRFKIRVGQLKTVREVREARKTIARILTLLKKKV